MKIIRILLVLSVIFLVGCPRVITITAYNNTGSNIELIAGYNYAKQDKETGITKWERTEETLKVDENKKLEFGFPHSFPNLKVQTYNNIFIYNLPFKENIQVFDNVFLQIESNGYIYWLQDDNFPVRLKDMPEQPEGFPLKPISIEPLSAK